MRKGDLEEGETEESEDQQVSVQGGKRGWDNKALKHAIGLTDEDLVYVSFTSEVPTHNNIHTASLKICMHAAHN